jgi:hypothetical protein
VIQVFISALEMEAIWSSETPANISSIPGHLQEDNISVTSDVRTQISPTKIFFAKKEKRYKKRRKNTKLQLKNNTSPHS